MLRIIYIFISITCLFTFSSCEKIVDLDLKVANPKLVIDASITENKPCIVYLTKSQAFDNNNPYETVTGAQIELSDSQGNTEILRESSTRGVYISYMLGTVGETYYLTVTVEGQSHSAEATVPQAIPIEETYIYEIKIGDEVWYSPSYIFYDPVEEDNYYYSILTVNDKIMNTIYLNDDEFKNGLKTHRILFYDKEDNNDEELKTGDKIKIEMQTLDKGMYTYYKSMFTVAAGGATNPITNLSGDVLGCFKAYNSTIAEFIVSPDKIYMESEE